MRDVLDDMIEIYQPKGIDWMGYKLTEENPYTFHHIKEKRYGGKEEVKNGAILTKDAHAYLNYLDQYCPEAYQEYQKIFRYINDFDGPIPEHLYSMIYQNLQELSDLINEGNIFEFREEPRDFKQEKKEQRKIKMKTKVNKPKKKSKM